MYVYKIMYMFALYSNYKDTECTLMQPPLTQSSITIPLNSAKLHLMDYLYAPLTTKLWYTLSLNSILAVLDLHFSIITNTINRICWAIDHVSHLNSSEPVQCKLILVLFEWCIYCYIILAMLPYLYKKLSDDSCSVFFLAC